MWLAEQTRNREGVWDGEKERLTRSRKFINVIKEQTVTKIRFRCDCWWIIRWFCGHMSFWFLCFYHDSISRNRNHWCRFIGQQKKYYCATYCEWERQRHGWDVNCLYEIYWNWQSGSFYYGLDAFLKNGSTENGEKKGNESEKMA